MTSTHIFAPDLEGTHAVAMALAPFLGAGDAVLLDGPLGVGKTAFVQGLARALEIEAVVTSPTFAIANIYPGGRAALLHVDAYRLESLDLFRDLALEEQLETSVTCIEWGTHVAAAFPEHLALDMQFAPEGARVISAAPHGARWVRDWERVRATIGGACA